MKAIVTGMVATYPVGGVAWDYLQYAIGLERLGVEVTYLEDTGAWGYDADRREYGKDLSSGVRFLRSALGELSPPLAERWHVRGSDGTTYGLEAGQVAELVGDADLFLNVSGGCVLRDEYMTSPRKVLIDTDPGWNHFVIYPLDDSTDKPDAGYGYRGHDFFLTYAQLIGTPACALPTMGLDWQPTRPPVVLDQWSPEPPGERWTTVLSWDTHDRRIEANGVAYGGKELEFAKIESLPQRLEVPLEVAAGGNPPAARWRSKGWSVTDSHTVSRTPAQYRSYVQSSRGELSVAKNVYVDTRSGWFSCRSVCYLAAGRPAVLQDTGFSEVMETGEGVLAFADADGAERALAAVERDYDRHSEAARDLATREFAHDVVLVDLLGRVGLG